ncbi:MAG: NAD(P)/FAD-dependent oxidoreductase [Kordiimonadaceae bacterium]|nr:NAD(P)/FAD-dependent oxidoreductase [Kordiimonadaceae bacterium]MBO6568901.1 NAD(P)/FAD-dependent oxidoreductase [Kordiimonadaceae bacterium]MBO6965124.1 NAD(P)/FAD-dependent oxidoreductase [Kordiimonadaceae bacterium]
MKRKITRRDFLNGTQIAVGAAITVPILQACGVQPDEFSLPKGYYPPTKTGMRGSHDGSWEVIHARVAGEEWRAGAPEAEYDLVIVGGGISGLSAAYFYQQNKPGARILILDNHDDFGGHAKRNEFNHMGETRIGYGGTEAIDTPSSYSEEAKKLLSDIGVHTERFYDYYDQNLYGRHGLSKAIFFDQDTFGEDKLVRGFGKRSWQEFAADTPMSDAAKADFVRVFTSQEDYLPGKTQAEKYEILSKTSYEDYLRNYCKVSEEVISIYKRWGMSFWCVGIDEIPTTDILTYDGGMPGVEHTIERTGYRNDEPYIFHFPDGNASVARLLVRALKPEAMPGSTMEDVVTMQARYDLLDRAGDTVNIRLNSTAVHVVNARGGVDITYVRDGKPHKVWASKCIMACYNSAIPYLCPEMPQAQLDGLAYNVKVPLVYTKVLVPNWKPFAELGMDFVYYTGGFYKQVELAYPVSIGDYKMSATPEEPMILHMCHVPWVPDVQGPDQWRVGRAQILSTPFETFEEQAKLQLNQALAGAGFDADRDISAITVNRWSHGYAYAGDAFWEPEYKSEADKPWVKGRQPFGNIHVANSDAEAAANTNAAITQAHRAVAEILT